MRLACGADVFIIDDAFKLLNKFSLHYGGELGCSSLMDRRLGNWVIQTHNYLFSSCYSQSVFSQLLLLESVFVLLSSLLLPSPSVWVTLCVRVRCLSF